jgi:hypothetical protein
MGNSQSRPLPESWIQEKELLERLRAMQNDAVGEDYVHVDEVGKQRRQVNEKDAPGREHRQPKGLSVSDAEQWQKAMLNDPRSR